MSVIEDSRKVLQDFIAPELRSISVRLDALEKRFDGFEHTVEKQFDDVEHRAEKRHDEVMAGIRQVIDFNSIAQRVARLESKESTQQ